MLFPARLDLGGRRNMIRRKRSSGRSSPKIDPQNATILNYFGYMLADRGVRLAEAFGMIQKAVDLDPLTALISILWDGPISSWASTSPRKIR